MTQNTQTSKFLGPDLEADRSNTHVTIIKMHAGGMSHQKQMQLISAIYCPQGKILITRKQNILMQAGVKGNVKFPPSCNFYNEHRIQPISKPPAHDH